MYQLERKASEERVNVYKHLKSLIWKYNVDCQYIGEGGMILTRYVISYKTTGEK